MTATPTRERRPATSGAIAYRPSRRTEPAPSPREPAARTADLGITLALGLAVLLALAGLHELLAGVVWWVLAGAVALVVLGAGAAVRRLTDRLVLQLLAPVVVLAAVVTLAFAGDTAILGVVPTVDTLGRFGDLLASGSASIQVQGVPATAVPGILFILTAASGLVALCVDLLAFVARTPALTGVPLLAVVVMPGFIEPEFTDPLFFVLTAAAWLLVVYVASGRAQPGVAFGIGAVAIVASLVLPLALPSVELPDEDSVGAGYATGLNPIIDLGTDLRRPSPVLALTYTTTARDRQYLRMATLDEFTDAAWQPRIGSGGRANDPEQIPAAPDRAETVAVETSETTISVGNVRGRWLPLPYAPRSVTGLVGSWVWDPETFNVRTVRSSVRGQEYTVETEVANPTSDQLRAADPTLTPDLAPYTELPANLPPSVAAEALVAVGSATNNYDRAIALQSYFRDGDFSYSEDAPVENDYDGTSAAVIGRFLEEKSGYCVHFSSAMAAMARTLGIPARIAVGFTAGSLADDSDTEGVEFDVTTDELHAWPELHFAGVGWVRFEPTVGRNDVPVYSDAATDDPTTPDIDESVPTPVATDGPADVAPDRDDAGGITGGTTDAGVNGNTVVLSLAALVLLAVLGIPAMARFSRRRSRLRVLARDGVVLGVWDELHDTAVDLGWTLTDAETPREFAARLRATGVLFTATGPVEGHPITDAAALAALDRLRAAVELESFAYARPGTPTLDTAAASHDVRLMLGALRRGVGRGVRVRAALLPASVLARWFAVGARRQQA